MSKKSSSTRVLRQLAEELIDQMAEEYSLSNSDRADLATSLVRQWITYDGHATLFLDDEHQIYLHLVRTPLGRPRPVPEAGLLGWIKQFTTDFQISPDDVPEIIAQLNRGQSAEVTNQDGVPVRVWVNPKEKRHGAEKLVRQKMTGPVKRDYLKIAGYELTQQFGDGLDEDEMDELARSVARQWQKFGGFACVFVEDRQLMMLLTEQPDGYCHGKTRWISVEIKAALSSLGFAEEAIPEVIARINCGQEIEFRDKQGVPSVLWHDPRERRLITERLNAGPAPRPSTPPIFCPRCSAVLNPWRPGVQQQSCPHCGHTVVAS